jgi:HAD superfamily hydrolase (TIGR01509 family)
MLAGILWDNDGVLVNTERIFYEVNRDFLRQHRIELTEENFFDWFLCDNRGAWHLLAERGATPQEIDSWRRLRNALYTERLARETNLLNPGVDRILDRLRARMDMGIVTSASREHFNAVHDRLDIARHFKFVITEEAYASSKPSPEPYLLGLRKLGLPPQQCIVVEDSPRGLASALAAGIRCIVLRNSMTGHCRFEGAYGVADSIEELQAQIEGAQ